MDVGGDVPKYIIVLVWLAINVYLFVSTYFQYAEEKKFFYLKYVIRGGLPIARGAASVLRFNCMLVLLPVCRNLINLLKNISILPRKVSRLLDMNLSAHKLFAYTIALMTFVHAASHVYNIEHLVSSWSSADVVTGYLNLYEDVGNHTALNPVRKAGLDPIVELLSTVAGVSGVVITLALILMISSSTELIRRSYFEVFWFVHHLFVVFFIGLVAHGFGYLLRYQDNTAVHDPVVCSNLTYWNNEQCRTPPHFVPGSPSSWKWLLVPVIVFCIGS